MLRDVFYYGDKPNAHPKEKFAKNLDDARAQATTDDFWIINEFCDYRDFDWEFDFEFLPDEDVWAKDHNNIWPSQHQKDSGTWLCPKDFSDINVYRNDVNPVIRKRIKSSNWIITLPIDELNFDFSWHPDPTSPPYIYQFETQLEDIHLLDGPKYVTPGNNGETIYLDISLLGKMVYPKYTITTTLEDLISQHSNEIFWAIRDNIDYTTFNFDWKPTKGQAFNINVFGSADSELTQSYFVNAVLYNQGHTVKTYIEDTKIDETYLSTLFKKPNMFFIDKNNPESQQRFENLKSIYPDIQKTRYLNSWVDTINRCITKSSTELCWILNSELDYTDFDFNYYPNPWQMKMLHVFGTQWSHWGTTFVVNTETFANDTKYIKNIEHLANINFVKKSKAKATRCLYDIYFINHGNDEAHDMANKLTEYGSVYNVDYDTDYLKTFKNLIADMPIRKDHYVWVCSSICNYDKFDFTYICDPFSLEQLHVFPSDKQKYGDTFFVNINKLRMLIDDLTKLDDLEKINFNPTLRPTRIQCPVIINDGDTHTDFMKYEYNFPYAVYLTDDNKTMQVKDDEPISLWSADSKNIVVTSEGASRVIIPKEVKEYVKKELYDYPYITKSSRIRQSRPMDIVFLSNGESCAEENYEHLQRVVRGSPNRLVRVDGVNGRVAAYHAAAEASNTPWMFTVFAKLKVNEKFNWSWQPDRLQIPKHYIFTATNPVNGLVYGHQAMIAYNKKITLSNTGTGLDFTLDNEHEVVDMNSGTANYNIDEWTTWRTSFRECIKLAANTDEISQDRLKIWSTVANGNFAQYSLDGAKDAISYYNDVSGDLVELKKSYDWAWLREFYNKKYN